MAFRSEENGIFTGIVQFLNVILSPGSVKNTEVAAAAGISGDKLEHQHRANYAQPSGSVAAAETKVVHTVKGVAGTLKTFKAGSVTVCTVDAAITVDLHKNGSTVLAAPIVLDIANSARVVEAGTISGAAVVAGDVLEVVVTVAAGAGVLGNGPFAYVDLYEDAQ